MPVTSGSRIQLLVDEFDRCIDVRVKTLVDWAFSCRDFEAFSHFCVIYAPSGDRYHCAQSADAANGRCDHFLGCLHRRAFQIQVMTVGDQA